MKFPRYILFAAILAAVSCSTHNAADIFDDVRYRPGFAEGFEIIGIQDSLSSVIRVKAAWQGADSSAFDLFISRNGETPPEGFDGQTVNGPARRIVAMSSSYVAMLDLLKETHRIVGVSGIDFISNAYVREHMDGIADVGNETAADFETIAALDPNIVLLYGINASSAMEAMLRKLKIPYLYMGEYLEPSPLGRAEWIVAIAELTGCRDVGEAVFGQIKNRYRHLADVVPDDVDRPKVMLNTPYGDTWYMASRGTAMAAMIEDAGADYVYRGNSSNKSLPVDMEEAYILASEADFWLNTGKIGSLEELKTAYPKFSGVKSVVTGNVYNCDKRISGNGNDFWESGQVRPDLVLEDLIRIFHPEILEGGDLCYYRKLE